MADERAKQRGRRVGYVIAAAINLILWFLANVSPGWQAVPFLSDSTVEVLPLFNLAVLTQFAANLAYAAFDSTGLKRILEVPLTAISLALAMRVASVFPFEFDEAQAAWSTLAHLVVYVGVIGTAIALVVNVVLLVRWIVSSAARSGSRSGQPV